MSTPPVDLARVRAGLARLDDLAARYPDLVTDTETDAAAWAAILEDNEAMERLSKQTGFRLPPELIVRLDAYAAQFGAEHPGVRFTRADAVRALLSQALDAAGVPAGEATKPKRKKPTKPKAKADER